MSISQGTARHKLQFFIGNQPLPYNMTVYQAVKQYGHGNSGPAGVAVMDGHDTDTDSEHPFGPTGIWVETHTIW